MVERIDADEDTAVLLCLTPSGKDYIISSVDAEWIEAKTSSNELYSGLTILDLPDNSLINLETQTIELEAPPVLVNNESTIRHRGRKLTAVIGVKTILAVRVIAANAETSPSEAQLASDIFGGDGLDFVNVRSQYLACSHGKLDFQKATGRSGLSTSIYNGVVTVQVDKATSVGARNMVNAVNDELTRQFNTHPSNLASYVMYFLPAGTFGGFAYAYMNGYRSIFNDRFAYAVSIQMHELGHNLGLGHSGHGGDKYGDQSGLMGYSYGNDEAPKMCFNAAKSWQLGWYADKTGSATPSGKFQFAGRLGSIVDYPTTNTRVLIEIKESTSEWAYYLNYNAAKGFNIGTAEGRNSVLITKKHTGSPGHQSLLLSILQNGGSYSIPDFNGKPGETLKVEVHAMTADEAYISVKLDGSPTRAPSSSPSNSPSKAPSGKFDVLRPNPAHMIKC
ncbi:unnamed protein product [Cylindrotheca closterium]|uniref:Peptidase M11 gametolysin domain-containing protein n=1 Tax=Cylindrotheca closterium TaxID=2856 RepID=A0AAD2G4W7_9STRA|nr:unnamed protein product [Cylindrotheca closterium]